MDCEMSWQRRKELNASEVLKGESSSKHVLPIILSRLFQFSFDEMMIRKEMGE